MNYRSLIRIRRNHLVTAKLAACLDKNKTMILIGLILVCSIILSLGIITTKVTAERALEREKTVTSVRIEKGDSLWSIASQYITDEYKDMNVYIEEIKLSNGLTSDTIHEGRYIIVPYYTVKR